MTRFAIVRVMSNTHLLTVGMVSLLSLPLLGACSRGGYEPSADGATAADLSVLAVDQAMATSTDAAQAQDLSDPPDLVMGPTAEQCLEGWRMYPGNCPGPQITESHVGNGCAGTTGWFIEGKNFQLEKHNMGIADYGPQSIGANGDQKHWNVITTTRLCVTVSAAAKAAWVGHTIYVINPDGKKSNSVVVKDLL